MSLPQGVKGLGLVDEGFQISGKNGVFKPLAGFPPVSLYGAWTFGFFLKDQGSL